MRECLSNLGFTQIRIERIMNCVTSTNFNVRINGNLSRVIWPTRGFQQGDPISPYLYIICGEAFNKYLQLRNMRTKHIFPKIAVRGERVGLLQFADDHLIFSSLTGKALKRGGQCNSPD